MDLLYKYNLVPPPPPAGSAGKIDACKALLLLCTLIYPYLPLFVLFHSLLICTIYFSSYVLMKSFYFYSMLTYDVYIILPGNVGTNNSAHTNFPSFIPLPPPLPMAPPLPPLPPYNRGGPRERRHSYNQNQQQDSDRQFPPYSPPFSSQQHRGGSGRGGRGAGGSGQQQFNPTRNRSRSLQPYDPTSASSATGDASGKPSSITTITATVIATATNTDS